MNARRLAALFVCSVFALSLSGCVLDAEYGEAKTGAEGIISTRYFQVSTRFVEAVQNAAPDVVDRTDLEDAEVATYILLTDEEQAQVATGLPIGTVIFDIDESRDSPAIDVYIYGIGGSNRGFVTATMDRFACGRITYVAGGSGAAAVDLACPEWLTGWRGPSAEEVSLTAMVSTYPPATDYP